MTVVLTESAEARELTALAAQEILDKLKLPTIDRDKHSSLLQIYSGMQHGNWPALPRVGNYDISDSVWAYRRYGSPSVSALEQLDPSSLERHIESQGCKVVDDVVAILADHPETKPLAIKVCATHLCHGHGFSLRELADRSGTVWEIDIQNFHLVELWHQLRQHVDYYNR